MGKHKDLYYQHIAYDMSVQVPMEDISSSPHQEHHRLASTWSLYYHEPEDSNWTANSFVLICNQINSIERFWEIYNLLPKTTFHLGMFFLMREQILPIWETDANVNGGYWSYKVPIADVFQIWESLSAHLVSEQLTPTESQLLTGISISPKKGFCVIKIWNNNATKSSISLLHDIDKLNHGESMFSIFKDK